MVVPAYGGCLWPVDPACLTDEWDAFSEEVQERALALASSTLQRLTANRVGGCPVTVRPCNRGCSPIIPSWGDFGSFRPGINAAGYWINSCGCESSCNCSTTCEITLPRPVGAVYEVKVDGAAVSPDDYDIYNGNVLVYTGGGDCPWPATQDLSLPDTEVGTFSITFLNAAPVDALGAYAVGILAMEYAKACTGGKCRLPAGVTSISRQGVTMEIQAGSFPGGFTGIREVDAFIALWNPDGRKQQTRVWSPDQCKPRYVTVSGGGVPPTPPDHVLDGGGP